MKQCGWNGVSLTLSRGGGGCRTGCETLGPEPETPQSAWAWAQSRRTSPRLRRGGPARSQASPRPPPPAAPPRPRAAGAAPRAARRPACRGVTRGGPGRGPAGGRGGSCRRSLLSVPGWL